MFAAVTKRSSAAFLEPAAEPVPDGLGDDVSSIATRRAAELSKCLGRLRRGRQQIRSVTRGLLQVGFEASCEKQRRL